MRDGNRSALAEALEKRRIARGIRREELCVAARLSLRGYTFFLAGTYTPRQATLERLDAALDELAPRASPPAPKIIALFHANAMAAIAAERHVAIGVVMTADFSRQRPRNRKWLQAARIRGLAMYITVAELGIGQAELARALGISKTAVAKALTQIEEAREDGGRLDRLIERVAIRLKGK